MGTNERATARRGQAVAGNEPVERVDAIESLSDTDEVDGVASVIGIAGPAAPDTGPPPGVLTAGEWLSGGNRR